MGHVRGSDWIIVLQIGAVKRPSHSQRLHDKCPLLRIRPTVATYVKHNQAVMFLVLFCSQQSGQFHLDLRTWMCPDLSLAHIWVQTTFSGQCVITLQPLSQSNDTRRIRWCPPLHPSLCNSLSLSLSVYGSPPLSPSPSLPALHIQKVFFPPKSPLQHFSKAHTQSAISSRSDQDATIIKSRAWKYKPCRLLRWSGLWP